MSEEEISQAAVAPPPSDTVPAQPGMKDSDTKDATATRGSGHEGVTDEHANKVATSETTAPAIATKEPDNANDGQSTTDTAQDKPAAIQKSVEMKEEDAQHEDLKAADAAARIASDLADPGVDTPASAGKFKGRRKSGGPEHKNKKLNKKASKAKMTHTDAKPGDYFMVRLKGYPPWPAIICDESMLPSSLIKSRPVTAAGPDGTYRADYEDGGSKVKDRTFPVMYLFTNEFGWVPNTDLNELDFDTVGDVPSGMRKDLHAAHLLAAEKHDLDYFKQILKSFMEQRAADLAAKEAAKAAKKAGKVKRQSKATVQDDGDVKMAGEAAEPDSEDAEVAGNEKTKKSKKRKAEEDGATPQRSDSAKKPKTVLKLTNNTPKSTSTPKTPKDQSTSKASKPKTKKAAPKPKEPEFVAPKEPELTPEEKRVKKEKEILFLRHRLQKGLLIRDQDPKEEEMKPMSEFISKLEGYADLEVSIIRATKINKVLKAILKLNTIPKEEEFNFKARSQALLDKWNKLLAVDQDTPGPPSTNGVKQDVMPGSVEATNGVKGSPSDGKVGEKKEESAEAGVVESTEKASRAGDAASLPVEETHKKSIPEPAPVESTA